MKIKIMMMMAILMIGMAGGQSYQGATTFDGNITMDGAGIDLGGNDLMNWQGMSRTEITPPTATIIHRDDQFIAVYRNGSVLASGPDTDIGQVFNDLVVALREIIDVDTDRRAFYALVADGCLPADILIDIDDMIPCSTPMRLYSFMTVRGPCRDTAFGLGSALIIYTDYNMPIFYTTRDYYYKFITISDMELLNTRTGSDFVTVPMIWLNQTGYSTISRIFIDTICDFDLYNSGGIRFDGDGTRDHFLNKIIHCHLNILELIYTDDTWVSHNQFASWNSTASSIIISNSNDAKIRMNHICVPEHDGAIGIYIEGNTSRHSIIGNYIETTTPRNTVTNYGIYDYGYTLTDTKISDNHFISMGRDIIVPITYTSTISGNIFRNSNYGDDIYASTIYFQGGDGNVVTGNVGYKPISGKTTYLIYGTAYCNYDNNIAKGYYSDVVVNEGTGSNEDNSLLVGA